MAAPITPTPGFTREQRAELIQRQFDQLAFERSITPRYDDEDEQALDGGVA